MGTPFTSTSRSNVISISKISPAPNTGHSAVLMFFAVATDTTLTSNRPSTFRGLRPNAASSAASLANRPKIGRLKFALTGVRNASGM